MLFMYILSLLIRSTTTTITSLYNIIISLRLWQIKTYSFSATLTFSKENLDWFVTLIPGFLFTGLATMWGLRNYRFETIRRAIRKTLDLFANSYTIMACCVVVSVISLVFDETIAATSMYTARGAAYYAPLWQDEIAMLSVLEDSFRIQSAYVSRNNMEDYIVVTHLKTDIVFLADSQQMALSCTDLLSNDPEDLSKYKRDLQKYADTHQASEKLGYLYIKSIALLAVVGILFFF